MGTPLHEAFGRIGEPTRHERGFVEGRVTREQIDHIAEEAVRLWKSDVGPYIEPLLPWYDGEPIDSEDSKWMPAKFVFHAKPRTLSELRARPQFFTEDGDGERPGQRRGRTKGSDK